jgi:hypothetical protein
MCSRKFFKGDINSSIILISSGILLGGILIRYFFSERRNTPQGWKARSKIVYGLQLNRLNCAELNSCLNHQRLISGQFLLCPHKNAAVLFILS